jgi:group I intron endonuclease
MTGVYLIFNRVSKRMYVGSSFNIKTRFRKHKLLLNNNTHHCIHLQRAWNKYGEQSFKFSLLEKTILENLIEREQFWIDKLKNKYNSCPTAGSTLGYKHSKEAKQKQSILASKRTGKNNYWYGKSLPKHVLDKAAEICSEKFKGEGNPFFGQTHLEESKIKMSQKLKGRKMGEHFCQQQKGNERGAKNYEIKLPSGEIIEVINLAKFCRENSLYPANAYTAIKNGTTYKGYSFSII